MAPKKKGAPAGPEAVWVANPDAKSEQVYLKGEGTFSEDGQDCKVQLSGGKEMALKAVDVLKANPEGLVCSDNTMLIHLSEATLLENVRLRYEAKDIYTLTGTILLVTANPEKTRRRERKITEPRRARRAALLSST